METARFAALTRHLTRGLTRRHGLGVLASLGLPDLFAPDAAEAKKKCPPCKKRLQGKCKKKPDGTACAGGSCQRGSCVATVARCVPHCGGNDCGNDGCDGSCGSCAPPLECQGGLCTCFAEECNGTCVLGCEAGDSHHPITCECCRNNGLPCAAPGPDTSCCSGNCVEFVDDIYGCFVQDDGQECDFAGQCASNKCAPNCAGFLCTDEKFCQPV